uniref:Macaca fascicularis brain cDNA clone: QflA-19774, similar to human mitochondrial ribosomal protein L42 (MRPL42), nucleargene encoding mitochondrial protein, transcript variant1, mRNA, RefSeq: NM_01... n=1 Tax=Macaca fascicularis TaxID=9541 RepID=I7GLX6_MACFA|nr:unnamed protein product [Macaca fascicularis]
MRMLIDNSAASISLYVILNSIASPSVSI